MRYELMLLEDTLRYTKILTAWNTGFYINVIIE